MKYRHAPTRFVAIALTSVLALVSAGCSSNSEEAVSEHNSQDIAFANHMIPHHTQAVEMANLAPSRAFNPQVKQLALRIQAAQEPEIDTMNGWLKGWGQPEVDPVKAAAQDHSNHETKHGILPAHDIAALESASGASFDELFLQGMIKHHEGAVAEAKVQQQKGQSKEALALAGTIIANQEAELRQMRNMLG